LAAPSLAQNLVPVPAAAAPTRVVVMPSGHAYLVLSVEPEQRDDALTCEVLYLAGDDAVELARPGAQERVAAAAREFLAAFAPLVEIAPVERFSVTAMFGKPGRSGAFERLWFARAEGAWQPEAGASERAVAQVPPIPINVLRDPDKEASAHATAAEFISDADRADYDAAWAKTSAVVKAFMSRADFERTLSERARPRGDENGKLYLSFPVQADRLLPGSNVEAWVARETAGGPIVETLALRLDDDLRWRVAAVVQLRRTAAASATARRARTPAVEVAESL
jgi:hypothetical protein